MPGATSMVVIGITALIVFGPSKLPDIGRAFGHSLREFKNALKELYRMTTKKLQRIPLKIKRKNPNFYVNKSYTD